MTRKAGFLIGETTIKINVIIIIIISQLGYYNKSEVFKEFHPWVGQGCTCLRSARTQRDTCKDVISAGGGCEKCAWISRISWLCDSFAIFKHPFGFAPFHFPRPRARTAPTPRPNVPHPHSEDGEHREDISPPTALSRRAPSGRLCISSILIP
jgi:hypothetical protein